MRQHAWFVITTLMGFPMKQASNFLAGSRRPAQVTRECEQHGQFVADHLWGDLYTGCLACWDAEQAEQAIARARQERERVERERSLQLRGLIASSGLRGRYLDAVFASYEVGGASQRKALETCRGFVKGLDASATLWLMGIPGTGKTHLGAAMVRAVIETCRKPAHLAKARDIIRELRDTWRRDSDQTEKALLEFYGRQALLVIDEVGGGFCTEGEQVQLLDVIDRRYELRHPTVLISNLNKPEMRSALGERAFDRLREGAQYVIFDWESYRGRDRARSKATKREAGGS